MSLVMYTNRMCAGLFTPYGKIDEGSTIGERPFFPVYLPCNKRVVNQYLQNYIQVDLDKVKAIDMNLIADFTSIYFSNDEKKGKALIYNARFDVISDTDIVDILSIFAFGTRPNKDVKTKINCSRLNPSNHDSWFVVQDNILTCYNGVRQERYILFIDSPVQYNIPKTGFSYRALEQVVTNSEIVNEGDQYPMICLSQKTYECCGYFVTQNDSIEHMNKSNDVTIYKVEVVDKRDNLLVTSGDKINNNEKKDKKKNKEIDQKPKLLLITTQLRTD